MEAHHDCSNDEIMSMLAVGEQKMNDNRRLYIWLVGVVSAGALLVAATMYKQGTAMEANRLADAVMATRHDEFVLRMSGERRENNVAYAKLVDTINELMNKVHYDDGINETHSQERMNRHEELWNHERNGSG